MSQWRRVKDTGKKDSNQDEIVAALEKCGYSVETGHDDILVGAHGMTFWYEIKTPEKKGRLQDEQIRLKNEFKGHYRIVWCVEQILEDIKKRVKGVDNKS